MSRTRSIRGRVALVIGAVSGMEPATAQPFAGKGERVVVSDLDLPHARVACATIRSALAMRHSPDAARIVNAASTEALGATPGDSPSVVARRAVIRRTRALAVDMGSEGVIVNRIFPGAIETAMPQGFSKDRKAIFAHRRIALQRHGRPEEVAHMILSLVLSAASYTTGTVVTVRNP